MIQKATFTAMVLFFVTLSTACGQFTIVDQITTKGIVETVGSTGVVIKDSAGKSITVLIQSPGASTVVLKSGANLRSTTKTTVSGRFPLADLAAGQQITFQTGLSKSGKSKEVLKEIKIAKLDEKPGVEVITPASDSNEAAQVKITTQFGRIVNGRMLVQLPKKNGFSNRSVVAIPVDKNTMVRFGSNDFRKAVPGATVKKLVAVVLNTGDIIAREIEFDVIENTSVASSLDEALAKKYRDLSDEPRDPRLVRSAHCVFLTDLSDRESKIVLDKLETMFGILTRYFGKPPTGIIEGFVVRDLSRWDPAIFEEPYGLEKIKRKEGVCFSTTLGSNRRAILYSYADHGTIQHECTHGFCHMAFGSTGPTWLSEGVAEMGAYWKAGQQEVEINPTVMRYLQQTTPKRKLLDIAIPGRTDAGGWQDYAWRWALCYMLANNPNYQSRFRPLAVALMEQQADVSFESVYGPVAPQISFEYDLFQKHIANGYRADLCAWNWREKFTPLAKEKVIKKPVIAAYGWQPSGVQVEAGKSYDVAAVGDWNTTKAGVALSADGETSGRGKLVGVIMKDMQLSEPFDIGVRSRFLAPTTGRLYLRCQDEFHELADNSGELLVHIRLSPSE